MGQERFSFRDDRRSILYQHYHNYSIMHSRKSLYKSTMRCSHRATCQTLVVHNSCQQRLSIRRSDMVKSTLLSGISILAGSSGMVPPSLGKESVPALSKIPPVQVLDEVSIGKVMLSTLSDCSLAVSIYPTFSYNASGGGGVGRIVSQDGDIATVEFDIESLSIPPIDYRSTKVLGIPIPPPLSIQIVPKELKGNVNMKTGEANLDFDASFQFDAGSLYHAAPLSVVTTLSTEGSSGDLLQGSGVRLNGDGKARFAGVAKVPKTGDSFLDGFLLLPSEALAVLSAELRF